MTRTKSTYLALVAVLLSPMAANAVPITIGSLSSNDDGSTDIIADSLNNLDWLRWDVIPNLNYADTVTYAATNGWSIAGIAEAQLFVDALFGGASCNIATDGNGTTCGFASGIKSLTGDNYQSGSDDVAWFLSDDGDGQEVGYLFSQQSTMSIFTYPEWRTIGVSDRFADGGASASVPITWMLYRPTSVPEPSSLALLGLGLAGMGLARRRRKA